VPVTEEGEVADLDGQADQQHEQTRAKMANLKADDGRWRRNFTRPSPSSR
jgi:hypothetical protein